MRRNKHGYIGVYFSQWTRTKRYRARIRVDNRTFESKTYSTATEAARAYDTLALLHRDKPRLNFPLVSTSSVDVRVPHTVQTRDTSRHA